MQARDWPKSLWPASYKGVPFFFEHDDEHGGRNPIVHVFPNRDDPFVEDLGEEPRYFSGLAYVHGDDADAQARSLIAVLAARGPGVLVTPLFGPVTVQAQPFHRKHEKDKLGLVAFEVKFVRDGAASALISVASLANVAFGAADRLAAAAADNFSASVTLAGQPDFVVAAVGDGFDAAAAAIDALRTSYPVDPAASAQLRDAVADLLGASPAVFADVAPAVPDVSLLATNLVQAARDLTDALPAVSAAAAAVEMADAFIYVPITHRSPLTALAAGNSAAAARLARLAALTAFAEALVRRDYASRPDGVSARGEAADRFDRELDQCQGAADAALALAIQDVRNAVVDYLTRLINDLAPIVTVVTARPLPSLALAWRLYANPQRAPELVARNRVRHPSFMPTEFAALAS